MKHLRSELPTKIQSYGSGKFEHNKAFQEAIELLRELHDHQNGPPIFRYEKEYNETMKKIQEFLSIHEK